ncbi:MAG TPA: tRNA (N6-threonylcarbamoyladenosine(37)-N6)-methyltransferase TrmO [Bryobacteraceae bacterium]|nr:tRNA (N6-threonylcarbamoyladenosine(37)-N6)-methyltransferase TrmO [Bryobacteraceae bacterium]
MHDQLKLEIIGVIETPFHEPPGCPIQPSRAAGAVGTVRVEPRFQAGLRDIEGFDRIWLLYWLHQAPGSSMLVTPFLDQQEHGIFATRAPARPSPIGLSVVRLLGVEDNLLHVADVDMVSGTPLLDIKPYVPEFDCYPNSSAGWFDQSRSNRCIADDRFASGEPDEGTGDR